MTAPEPPAGHELLHHLFVPMGEPEPLPQPEPETEMEMEP